MAIAAQEGSPAEVQSEDLERKPLLSFRAIRSSAPTPRRCRC
jgi:hypothetical protein